MNSLFALHFSSASLPRKLGRELQKSKLFAVKSADASLLRRCYAKNNFVTTLLIKRIIGSFRNGRSFLQERGRQSYAFDRACGTVSGIGTNRGFICSPDIPQAECRRTNNLKSLSPLSAIAVVLESAE